MAFLEKPGTLPRPGVIGRGVRLLAGGFILYLFLRFRLTLEPEVPPDAAGLARLIVTLVLLALLCLLIVPEVVGQFRAKWRWPSAGVFLALLVLAAGADFFRHGVPWGPALGWLLLITIKGLLLVGGISFVLAAFFGTPG